MTIVDAKTVSTTEIAAMMRMARRVARVQATAAGTANSGSTGAKNRAGGLEPAHHMAKCVTINRYGVITNSSSRARRRKGCRKNIATKPAKATATTGA